MSNLRECAIYFCGCKLVETLCSDGYLCIPFKRYTELCELHGGKSPTNWCAISYKTQLKWKIQQQQKKINECVQILGELNQNLNTLVNELNQTENKK